LTDQPHLYQFDLDQGDRAAAHVGPYAHGRNHPGSSAAVAVTHVAPEVVTFVLVDSRARAFNERGEVVDGPTSEDIRTLLNGLTSANRFLIVERLDAENDEHYMQAYLQDGGAYWLEYREGAADTHFQTSSRSLRLVWQTFTMWLYRLPGWRDSFIWHSWPGESDGGAVEQAGGI
jgi:hypothetical protein